MRYVIPDIHGNSRTFRALLDKIGFGINDRLYLLGDYIDRGPDSKGLLDYIMQLIEDSYEVFPLKGNHEDWMIKLWRKPDASYHSWLMNGGFQTCRSFEVEENLKEVDEKYIEFLDSLPVYIEMEDFVLVHGGLNLYLSDPIKGTGKSDMMWERPYGRYDRYPWPMPGKKLVVGHTIRDIDRIQNYLDKDKDLIMLDNGCFCKGESGVGNLVALNLDKMQLTIQPNID